MSLMSSGAHISMDKDARIGKATPIANVSDGQRSLAEMPAQDRGN